MLPPDGQSDRFLTAKVLKLVGCRREKYVFCYVDLNSTTEAPKYPIAMPDTQPLDGNTNRRASYVNFAAYAHRLKQNAEMPSRLFQPQTSN